MPFTQTTLRAYRSDGTEVRPGDTITNWRGEIATFHTATRAPGPAGEGKIQLDSPFGREVYASAYDLDVMSGSPDIPTGQTTEPEPAVTGLRKLLATVDSNREELLAAAREASAYEAASERDAYLGALENLADEVRAQVGYAGDLDAMAADADLEARTTAPPVPGVTRNMGYTVYAVLPAGPRQWIVAGLDDKLNHVTWRAEVTHPDGYGTLLYSGGRYFTRGDTAAEDALASLAERAGVLEALTTLGNRLNSRETWQEARSEAMATLTETHGVGRARARQAVDEATALGIAKVTWHAGRQHRSWTVTFDRLGLTYRVRPGL